MFAIIDLGGTQYKVKQGDRIVANRLNYAEGESVDLDQVLLVADESGVKIGQPLVKDAKVSVKVTSHLLGEKLIAYKYRRRKDSASKKGHRQRLTALEVQSITNG